MSEHHRILLAWMIAYINLLSSPRKFELFSRDILIEYKANYKAIKRENLMKVRQDKLIKTLTKRSHSIVTALKLKFLAARYYLMQNSQIVMPAAAVRYCWLADCGFHAWNLNASNTNAFRDYTSHAHPTFCSIKISILLTLNLCTWRILYKNINRTQIIYLFLKVVLCLLSRNAHNILILTSNVLYYSKRKSSY